MKDDEKSKYHLVLLPLSHTMSVEKCADEVQRLQQEYLKLDNWFKLRDDLPLVKELMTIRFKELHQRICELNASKK